MGKWPDNDVFAKCCDVYELFNSEKKEDWMLSYEFLDDERTVVIVEEENPIILWHRSKRLFFGFNGVNLNVYEISDRESLEKILFSIYKSDNYFGFQNKANDSLKLILTKLKQLEACEENDEFSYEVFFCGYSIGGSIAATAFLNLLTRFKFKSENIPEDSTMMLPSIPGGVNNQIRYNFQEFEIDQKIKLESGREYYCITHGAAMFGNQMNKEYCFQQRFCSCIFNIVHEKDPVPKLFHHSMATEYQNIQGSNSYAIGNFLLLQYSNGKFCPNRIENGDNKSIEDFFSTTANLIFDLNYHLLDIYKRPVNPGNTDLDIINRINKDMEDSKKPYVITEFIGEGSYGFVFKATNENDVVAIKMIKAKYHNNERDNREIINLSKLTNPNVVKFIEHFDSNQTKTLYLVFEYCLYGSLESYIMSTANKLEIEEIREVSFQLLLGLSAIHCKKIIHRDIKPANILVTCLNNGNPRYKISDFGSSVQYERHLKLLSVVGTPIYTSPEIYLAADKDLIKVKLGKKTDIFSLGAVILFCIKKKTPWLKNKFSNLIESGFEKVIATDYKNEPKPLKDMLVLMLQSESYQRFSAESLLLHPFIKRESVMIHEEGRDILALTSNLFKEIDLLEEFLNSISFTEYEDGIKFRIENFDLEKIRPLLKVLEGLLEELVKINENEKSEIKRRLVNCHNDYIQILHYGAEQDNVKAKLVLQYIHDFKRRIYCYFYIMPICNELLRTIKNLTKDNRTEHYLRKAAIETMRRLEERGNMAIFEGITLPSESKEIAQLFHELLRVFMLKVKAALCFQEEHSVEGHAILNEYLESCKSLLVDKATDEYIDWNEYCADLYLPSCTDEKYCTDAIAILDKLAKAIQLIQTKELYSRQLLFFQKLFNFFIFSIFTISYFIFLLFFVYLYKIFIYLCFIISCFIILFFFKYLSEILFCLILIYIILLFDLFWRARQVIIQDNTTQHEATLGSTTFKDIWYLMLISNSVFDLDDFIISAALNLLQQQYPAIKTQPPSVHLTNGYNYCPYETIQIAYNADHWILLSSINGNLCLYDSLNTLPTKDLMKQMSELFSPDSSTPPFQQKQCHKQNGSRDSGIFAIAYAVEILNNKEPNIIIYDQSKMRNHLIDCLFEKKILSPFPKSGQNSVLP